MAAELEIKPSPWVLLRVLGVMLAATGIACLLMLLLVGGGGDIFAQRTTLTTYLPDATGLSTDSEIRLSGIRIGQVSSVMFSGKLDPQRPVRVDMRILKRYLKSIPVDSQTAISTDTLVGWAFVDITEGKSPASMAEYGVLESEPFKLAADRANMMRVLTENLTQVDQLLIEISSGETKVGQFVLGSEAYDKALSKISNFDEAMRQFVAPQSAAGQVLFSPKLYDQVRTLVLNADKTLLAIQSGEGAAGHLFTSDDQYNAAVRQLTALRTALAEANAGKGSAGALLRDDDGYRRLQKMLAATDAMITSLNHGEGKAAELMANPQLYESLNGSLRGLEALLKDLRESPQKHLRYKLF